MAGLEISPEKVGFVIVKAREMAAKVAAWDAAAAKPPFAARLAGVLSVVLWCGVIMTGRWIGFSL